MAQRDISANTIEKVSENLDDRYRYIRSDISETTVRMSPHIDEQSLRTNTMKQRELKRISHMTGEMEGEKNSVTQPLQTTGTTCNRDSIPSSSSPAGKLKLSNLRYSNDMDYDWSVVAQKAIASRAVIFITTESGGHVGAGGWSARNRERN